MSNPFPHPPLFANRDGFVALMSVLIIGAIGVVLTTTLLWGGTGSLRTSLAWQHSSEARALADACAEYALNQLRHSSSYAGAQMLTIGNGSCQIEPIGGSGNTNRTLKTIGYRGVVVRRVLIQIASLHPKVVLTSWQEVNQF